MSPVSRRGGGGRQGTWPRLVKSSILRTSKVAARGKGGHRGEKRVCVGLRGVDGWG